MKKVVNLEKKLRWVLLTEDSTWRQNFMEFWSGEMTLLRI